MAIIKTTISKVGKDTQAQWIIAGYANHEALRTFQYLELSGKEGPVAPILEGILDGFAQLRAVVLKAPVDAAAKEKTAASIAAVDVAGVLGLAYAAMRGQHMQELLDSGALPAPTAEKVVASAPAEEIQGW